VGGYDAERGEEEEGREVDVKQHEHEQDFTWNLLGGGVWGGTLSSMVSNFVSMMPSMRRGSPVP